MRRAAFGEFVVQNADERFDMLRHWAADQYPVQQWRRNARHERRAAGAEVDLLKPDLDVGEGLRVLHFRALRDDKLFGVRGLLAFDYET